MLLPLTIETLLARLFIRQDWIENRGLAQEDLRKHQISLLTLYFLFSLYNLYKVAYRDISTKL